MVGQSVNVAPVVLKFQTLPAMRKLSRAYAEYVMEPARFLVSKCSIA